MSACTRYACGVIAIALSTWGCGGGETASEDAGSGIECQVDSDCAADERCNLRTNECESTGPGGPTDTGTDADDDEDVGVPPVDTGDPEDTGDEDDVLFPTPDSGPGDDGTSQDTSPEDGGADEDTSDVSPPEDTGEEETGTDATGDGGTTDGGGSGDAGGSFFSGCQSDSECAGYQTCDTATGRCEDSRPSCTTTEDCGTSARCFGGRCVSTCGPFTGCQSGGLSCQSVSTGSGSVDLCLATCTPFSSNTGCSPDTKCAPYFGSNEGLCRGVGRNSVGDSCETDWGEEGCRSGSVCLERRGEKTCQSFCSSSGSPSCGSDAYCTGDFDTARDGSDASDPAGLCLTNCGGLGNTDASTCDSGESCQPESSSEGFCTEQGTVAQDGRCDPENDTYCEVPSACYQTDETEGVCRSACDPTKSESANRCSSGQACVQTSPDYGICLTACSETGSSNASSCPSYRPACYGLDTSRTVTPSSTSGVCGPS